MTQKFGAFSHYYQARVTQSVTAIVASRRGRAVCISWLWVRRLVIQLYCHPSNL